MYGKIICLMGNSHKINNPKRVGTEGDDAKSYKGSRSGVPVPFILHLYQYGGKTSGRRQNC